MPLDVFPHTPELGMRKIGGTDKFIIIVLLRQVHTNGPGFFNPFPVNIRVIQPANGSPSFCVSAWYIM